MINILQLTDTHLFADPEGSLYSVNTRETLAHVIQHVQENVQQVDAILMTGDLVHDESGDGYAALKSLIEGLGYPVYYLPGNHDDPVMMSKLLTNCVNDDILSFNEGAWSIALMDSSVPGKVEGELSAKTLDKLKRYLSGTDDKNILIALHHHIVDVNSAWLDALNLRNHAQLTAMLDKFPNVKVVINGHVHQEIDAHRNGVRYLGTPATCFQFITHSENGGADDRPPGYRHIVLNDDGSIDTTVHYV